MTGRILVVRGGALGDFVLGLPALGLLRDAFPDARLELVGPGPLLSLARPLVDASAPLDRAEFAALFGDGPHLPESLVERYGDLDLVVLWLVDPDGAVRGNFARLGAKRVLQAPALPQGPGVHAADHLVGTLAGLEDMGLGQVGKGLVPFRARTGDRNASATSPDATPWRASLPASRAEDGDQGVSGDAPIRRAVPAEAAGGGARGPALHRGGVPRVSPGPAARQAADALWRQLGMPGTGRVMAIHPGSGGRWKCWLAERFARVAEELAITGAQPVVIQGPADEEAVGRLLAATHDTLPVVAGLDVEALAAFLGRCSVYLGNDSGVTHLAAAAGAPVVAVFGPTDPAVWGPRGGRVAVLREVESLEAVSVEQVVAAINGMM